MGNRKGVDLATAEETELVVIGPEIFEVAEEIGRAHV